MKKALDEFGKMTRDYNNAVRDLEIARKNLSRKIHKELYGTNPKDKDIQELMGAIPRDLDGISKLLDDHEFAEIEKEKDDIFREYWNIKDDDE